MYHFTTKCYCRHPTYDHSVYECIGISNMFGLNVSVRCGNFPMALEAMASGAIKPEKLLTQVYPFKDAEVAIQHAGSRGTLKIQLNMEDDD